MKPLLFMITVFALGVDSTRAEPDPKKADKPDSRLVGRWTAVQSLAGTTDTTEDPPRLEYEFGADGQWIIRRNGKAYTDGPRKFATYTSADPARIDLICDSDDPKKRTVDQCIYQVDGDTLFLRMPGPGETRPESFEASKTGARVIFKRVK